MVVQFSDYGDDLWDCTSSEGDDIFEDDNAKKIERQKRIDMVANRFAQVFGGLMNKTWPPMNIPTVKKKLEEGILL